MYSCNKCKDFGLRFEREYEPTEFIAGKVNSKIWIVGLNPAIEVKEDNRTTKDLSTYFDDSDNIHNYFNSFKKVSKKLFGMLGKEDGVSHVDIVKCSSKKWPPSSCSGKAAEQIIDNCKVYLIKQIKCYQPRLIICNGVPVSRKIQEILEVNKWLTETTYESIVNEKKTIVVLAGFIGRIDNFAKKRLGYEIDSILESLEI